MKCGDIMETCPVCNCLITENKCVMCGYELNKYSTKQDNSGSVFDIFDFIDGKNIKSIDEENNKKDNNVIYKNNKTGTKYEKQQYIEEKYNNSIKKDIKDNKTLSNNNTNNIPHNTFKPKVTKNKSFKIPSIIYIILFFINPALAIIFYIVGGIIESGTKAKNKN